MWTYYGSFIHLLLVGMFSEFIVTACMSTGDMVLSEVPAGGVTVRSRAARGPGKRAL